MRLISFVIAVITIFSCFGHPSEPDSVKVYFRVSEHQYDPAFRDNKTAMENFMKILKKAKEEDKIESIDVRAYTSPDGTSNYNQRLSKLRCDAIADYITNHLEIDPTLIKKIPGGIAWNGLRELVAENPDVPSRTAVLNILDNTPVWVYDSKGRVIDGRKNQLMSLNRGIPYRWMLNNLFPQLRNGVVISIIMKETPEVIEDKQISNETQEKQEPEEPREPIVAEEPQPEEPQLPVFEEINDCSPSNFALKTNLLYYLALMPNIQFEWMFHDRWSVALETEWAWYAKDPEHKVYRLGVVSPEIRYWPIRKSKFHGLYVGAFGGIGLYDLSNGKRGYEGEGAMGGISCGYMWPITKHLSFDAGVGVGYMRTSYKEYRPLDGHFLYVRTKRLNYFGPLSLRLSLSWIIPCCRKIKIEKSVK